MRFERIKFVLIAVLLLASCSQTPQAREQRFLGKGKTEFAKKNYSAAILHFRNAMAAQPMDAEPYYQIALVHLASGDLNSAASFLFKATSQNPKHTGAQLKLAELLSGSGSKEDVEEAQKRALGVLELLPDNLDAIHTLAVTEIKLGKVDHAEELLLRILRKSPTQLKSSVALAKAKVSRNDAQGAEETLKQAAAADPKSPEPRVYLGGFYASQNKISDAEQQFRRALGANPKHAPALISLADLQQRAGQTAQAEQTYRQIAALPEKQYRSAHAQYLFQTGKQADAVAELEKVFAADRADRNLRTELVRAYLSLNRIGDAEKLLTEALKKNGRDTAALLQRSRIYLSSKKYTEAQNDLNQVLHFQSQSAEAHYLLAQVYQAFGNSDTQKQELGEALRVDPKYLVARLELAQVLLSGRGEQAALNLLEETPAEQKDAIPVELQRNWALLALGQKAEARKGIDRILSKRPVPEVLLQDAALKMNQKDYAGGRAAAEKALAQNPDDVRALNLVMQSYSATPKSPAALQKVREYAQGRPGSAAVQQYLGEMLLAYGDRPGARKAFEAAKASNPKLLSVEFALAEMDTADGRLDEARKRLQGVIDSNPGSVSGRLRLAEVEARDGKPALATEQYRKVVEVEAKNVIALNGLAYLLADGKHADEALKFAQMAKQLAPENAAIDDTLGWTYFQKGMYTMAVTHLESAAAREGKPIQRYHLAMAYLKAGDCTRGAQNLDAALKMDPNLPEAKEARQLFANSQK